MMPCLRFLSSAVGEVAFEPFHVAVAFEGEHVGGDAVEKEAVVADDDGAAGEVEQGLFERTERVERRGRWSARRVAEGSRRPQAAARVLTPAYITAMSVRERTIYDKSA